MARATRRTEKPDPPRPSRRRDVGAGITGTLSGLLLAGAIAVGIWGLPRLADRASSRAAARETKVGVAWPRIRPDAPTWLDQRFQDEILTIIHEQIDRHPDQLGRRQLAAIGEALSKTGWFAEGPFVERAAGGEIRVRARWRVQAAAVRSGGSDYLVAWGGELLPRRWRAGESGMPVIIGARFDPPGWEDKTPAYGEVWPGDEIHAGLELLALLRNEPYWDQVEGVDVSSSGAAPGRERLVILTRAGTRIVFGARASNSGIEFGEVSTERKLWNLRQVYARYGRIDAGRNELPVHAELVIVEEPAGRSERAEVTPR